MRHQRVRPLHGFSEAVTQQEPVGGQRHRQRRGGNVGARLLQRQRKKAQVARQRGRVRRVAGRHAAPALGPPQQEGRGLVRSQQVQVQAGELGGDAREPAGHQHVASHQAAHEGANCRGRLRGVHVVQDQQPAPVVGQPVQHALQTGRVIRGVQRAQAEDAGQRCEIAVQIVWRLGYGEEQRGVVVGAACGELNGEPRLPDTAEAEQGAADDRRAGAAVEAVVQPDKIVVAADEQFAQARVRQEGPGLVGFSFGQSSFRTRWHRRSTVPK